MPGVGAYVVAQNALQATVMFFKRECEIYLRTGTQPMPLSPTLKIVQGIVEQAFAIDSEAKLRFEFAPYALGVKLIGPVVLEDLLKFVLAGGKVQDLWQGIVLKTEFLNEVGIEDPYAQRGTWILEAAKEYVTFGESALWLAS